MTIKEFRQHFNEKMSSIYPTEEIDSLFVQLIEYAIKMNRAEIVLNGNSKLDQSELNSVIQFMKRLEKKEPIQYIIGQTNFAGIPIHVNRHVLIPRPETESMVYWIKNQESGGLDVLDICTGSGCIAFALEDHIEANVTAWDISNDALKVAKKLPDQLVQMSTFHRLISWRQFKPKINGMSWYQIHLMCWKRKSRKFMPTSSIMNPTWRCLPHLKIRYSFTERLYNLPVSICVPVADFISNSIPVQLKRLSHF